MRTFGAALACTLLFGVATARAGDLALSGDYLEARTCDVYTGPCFANSEVGLAGQYAVMAWNVSEGAWKGVDLQGLSVAAAVKGGDTLGMNGPLAVNPFPIKAVVYVDERATKEQRVALLDFAKAQAGRVLENVVRVENRAIRVSVDHKESRGYLTVNDAIRLETRAVNKKDCICTNEEVMYPPLVTTVEDAAPAVTVSHEFSGSGLDTVWKSPRKRGAFVATFSL